MKWRALLSALGSAAFALGAFAFAFFCAVDVQFGDLRFAVGNTTMRHWTLVPMVGANACAMPLLGGGFPCVATSNAAPPIPAHIQSAESPSTTTPGASATFANPVGNGHLVAGVASYSNTCTLGTITDDSAVQATQVDTGTDTTEGQKSTSFYFVNVTDSLRTVTENVTGAGCTSSVIIDEYSGVATVSPLDQHAVGTQLSGGGTGANGLTSGSVTTGTAGELIYGVNSTVGGATTITAGTGFTLRQTQTGLQQNLSSEDKVQAVAGAVAATFTTNNGGASTNTNVMTFKP